MRHLFILAALGAGLSGCGPPLPDAVGQGRTLSLEGEVRLSPPPTADAGKCWHQEARPGVYESVTLHRLDAARGILSETRQREIRPRQQIWFRIPCPPEVGGADYYHASLQRALKARGLYQGAITGAPDGATLAAVQRFQSAAGLESATLSRKGAAWLGLIDH